MKDKVVQDGSLKINFFRHADSFSLVIEELNSGMKWGPSPLFNLEIHDKMQKRNDVISKYRIDAFENLENGVHISVGTEFHGIRVGIWFRLIKQELSVLIQPMEIYEDKTSLYRIFSIDLLPELMKCSKDGSLIIPITTGFRCLPADKAKISDRFMIYGEQERWELLPTLPFCAVETPKGGLMQLAVKGACDTECRVDTDGKGNGNARLGFSFRKLWPDTVDFENREIRIIPILFGKKADVFCGKRLRKHIIEDLSKKTVIQRAAESPQVKYLLDAYIMKMFFAIENDGICMYGHDKKSPVSFIREMTFDQAGAFLKKLHASGIKKILTESVGWNVRGHDGMYPTRLPIDERLGGENKFRAMNALGKKLGFQMSVHDNYIDSYKCAPNWDAETTIHDQFGDPLISGFWGGGINYRQWPLAFSHDRLEGEMRKIRELGLDGMHYCDGMGNPLEVNYHPKYKGPRSGHAKGICRILETARNIAGAAGTECGFLYCCVPSDHIAMNGWGWDMKKKKPDWAISNLCDVQLPIWHYALHDLVIHEWQGHAWKDQMNKVLFGAHLRNEWSGTNGLFKALDDKMIRTFKAEYDLMEKFRHLQLVELSSFQQQSAGFAVSKFSDGTSIEADFENGILRVNGKVVKRPVSIPLK